MFGLSNEIIGKINNITNKYSKTFVLFGSRARGDYKKNSDIDIAIIEETEQNEKYKIMNEFDELDIAYKIDLIFIQDIQNENFIKEIKKDGIKI